MAIVKMKLGNISCEVLIKWLERIDLKKMANFKTITFFKLLRETKDYQGKYVSQGALDFLSNSYCQVMYYIK